MILFLIRNLLKLKNSDDVITPISTFCTQGVRTLFSLDPWSAATTGHVRRILLSLRTLWCLSQSAVTCFTYRLLVRFHDNSALRFQRGLGPFLHLFRFRFKWQLLLQFSGNHEWIKMTSLAFHRLKIKKKTMLPSFKASTRSLAKLNTDLWPSC